MRVITYDENGAVIEDTEVSAPGLLPSSPERITAIEEAIAASGSGLAATLAADPRSAIEAEGEGFVVRSEEA